MERILFIFKDKPWYLNHIKNKFSKKFDFKAIYLNNYFLNSRRDIIQLINNFLVKEKINKVFFDIDYTSFIDKNFVSQIPEKFFIQNGYTKFLLRDTFSDILPRDISKNYQKSGFNFSFRTLFPLDDNRIIKFMEKKSYIYNYVSKEKILELYNKELLNDEENKFAFSFLTNKIFMEQLN